MRRLLLSMIVLLLFDMTIPVMAQFVSHVPGGTGVDKAGNENASGLTWLEEWDLWVLVDNDNPDGGVYILDVDGDEVDGFTQLSCDCKNPAIAPCGADPDGAGPLLEYTDNNLEDATIVAETGSDYLYVIEEDRRCVCKWDFQQWKDRTPAYDGTPNLTKQWCLEGATKSLEGMAFVPGGCTEATDECEGDGYFYVTDQSTALTEVWKLSTVDSTATRMGEWSHPCTSAVGGQPAVGNDGASLEYEWDSGLLYLTSDGSSNTVCVHTPRNCSSGSINSDENCAVDADCAGGTCDAFVRVESWNHPVPGSNCNIEGFGICPDCGYVMAAVDDGCSNTANYGAWRYTDAIGGCFVAADCDDSVACTDDTCASNECVFTANSGNCGDSNICTDDACNSSTGCAYSTSGVCDLSGDIVYYRDSTTETEPSDDAMDGVTVDLNVDESHDITDTNGAYSFGDLYGDVDITPAPLSTYDDSAITSFDASYIAQHMVQQRVLTDAQQIAADVTGTAGVTSFDAARIAQYCVNQIQAFAAGDWAFTPASYVYEPIDAAVTTADFWAILIGDVTGNWTPPARSMSIATKPTKEDLTATEDQVRAVEFATKGIVYDPPSTRSLEATFTIFNYSNATSGICEWERKFRIYANDPEDIIALWVHLDNYDDDDIHIEEINDYSLTSGWPALDNAGTDEHWGAMYDVTALDDTDGYVIEIVLTEDACVQPSGFPFDIELMANEEMIDVTEF